MESTSWRKGNGDASRMTTKGDHRRFNRLCQCAAILLILAACLAAQPSALAATGTFASRNPAQDFDTLQDAGNGGPHGLWSNGQTLWAADASDNKLYAYDLATKQRDPAKDFDTLKAAGNRRPTGIWSDGTTMWVADWEDDNIRAYRMSDKGRDSAKDFNTLKAAGNTTPTGIWSDGTTMWVADTADRIYAYKMSDKSRDSAKEIDTNSLIGNRYIQDIWSDGTTLWASNYSGFDNNATNKIYAFNLSERTREASKDFDTLSAAGNNKPRGIWSDGTTMWVADSHDGEDKIYAYRLSDAAVLSSLSLSGLRLSPAFDSGTAQYTASILQLGAQTTVAATPFQSGASVVLSPVDVDTATAGHQVALANGAETTITITVTPSSGDARVYIVNVTNLITTRNSTQDFNTLEAAGNNCPQGIWSDGTTMWVTDSMNNVEAGTKIYAYDLVTKTRNPAEDFDILIASGNATPRDLWSDGTTMWVVDTVDDKVYAYKMSDKSRDASKDFNTLRNAGNRHPAGLWSNGTTMWVADWEDDKVYAYKMSDKSRDASKDFNTLAGSGDSYGPNGLWSDGTTMWISDPWQDKIYAYKMSDKSRDASKDFDTLDVAGNGTPRSLWTDGTTMWVADYSDSQVYAYHLSNNAVLSGLSLSDNTELTPSFDGAIARYKAMVPYAVTNLTVAATALHTNAMVSILPADAGPNTDGHQAVLTEGVNDITITVTPSSGSARTYTIIVTRGTFATSRNPAQDFDRLDGVNVSPQGLWSDSATMWVADGRGGKIYAYKMSDKTRDAGKDFNSLITSGNANPATLWSNGTTIWVTDWYDDKLYAYNLATKQRDPSKDFNTLIVAGNTFPGGIWSDGTTMWVADSADGKIYAYKMADKSRDPSKDFDTLIVAGNSAPNRIWSDGTTMWVTNRDGDVKIYAYKMSDKSRDPSKDFDTLVVAGNEHPRGLWSDGTTMWVSDPWDDKIYAYRQPPAPSGDNALKALALSGVALSPAFAAGTTAYTASVPTATAMTTITAQANHASASVSISPADADANTAGHQVALAEGNNTITIMVTAESGAGKDYAIAVTRRLRSGDNLLRSLRLVGHALSPSFLPISTRYSAVVSHPVNLATIAAQASHAEATLAISPADADANTAGHQVVLAEGNNNITILVAAPNGDTKDYRIVIRRASIGVTGWNPLRDLALASVNGAPRGIWSDGETLWAADNQDAKLYAYNLADGRRLASSSDFNGLKAAGNDDPAGLWADGQTMWIADGEDDKLYAYNLTSKSHASTNDFALASGNDDPAGLWADGETLWVVDDGADYVYAYRLAGKSRNAGKEFALEAGNDDPAGLWADGQTMWIADKEDAKLYAYQLANGRRAAGKDFNTLRAAGNEEPWGLWGDGERLWVVDAADDKLYAYHAPPSEDASLKALALSGAALSPAFVAGTTAYTASVPTATAMTTITAQASHASASVSISPADADANTAGHQVALEGGNNTIVITGIAPNGNSRTYTVIVRRALASDASLKALALSGAALSPAFAAGTTAYTASVPTATAMTTITAQASHASASVSISPADADANTAGHQVALEGGNNTIVITGIAPNGNSRTYTIAIRRALSGDVSFGSLRLSPVLTFGQVAGSPTRYTATVAAATDSVTLTAAAKHNKAQVVIWREDADANAAGHQVVLAEGENQIALAVIAADKSVETYTIVVRRPAAALSGQAQRYFQARSVEAKAAPVRLAAARAFSGGVEFEFVMPLAGLGEWGVVVSSGLGERAKWRLLEEGEEYKLAWKDRQDGTARVTIILPNAEAEQTFLRLKPTN